MLSLSSEEGMNGGTVSMWVEKTISGLRSSIVATTLNRSCATGILWALYSRRQSSSYNSAPTAPSLPEMDSISMSLRVSLMGSMVSTQHSAVSTQPKTLPQSAQSAQSAKELRRPLRLAFLADG